MRLQEQSIAGMRSIQNLLGEALVAMRAQTEVMEASVYLIMFCGDHRYALLHIPSLCTHACLQLLSHTLPSLCTHACLQLISQGIRDHFGQVLIERFYS